VNGRRPFRMMAAAAAALLLAGCQQPGDTVPPPPPVNQPTAAGAPANGAGSPVGGGLLHAGRGWTATGIVGVFPPAGSCHLRFTPAGEPLPDPRCTPGAADQAVTQQNLHTTVCTPPAAVSRPGQQMVGSTIAGVIVALVALTVSLPICLATIGFFILYRLGEDYLLVPKIIGKAVDIPALVTVVAVLLGGALLGIIGALVAIPVAAAVLLFAREVLFPRLDRT